MLRRINAPNKIRKPEGIRISDANFPAPFVSGLEYATPARGTWNIVHTGMLIPGAHEIFVCAAGCLRGVVLTAAEMNAAERFSSVEIKENNIFEGDLEELLIEGVSHIIETLPKRPPAVLVYTSCVHHFAGCDLDMIYQELNDRFPDIDITDCYMNPIMRKSGMTPDEIMRSRLYMLLHEREKNEKSVAIIGNDLPTREESELMTMLRDAGLKIHEITSCRTYDEYQEMAEANFYISYNPAAVAGGEMLEERLGGTHLYVPVSYDYDEIDAGFAKIADVLGIEVPDFSAKRVSCEAVAKEALDVVGDVPISIDYSFSTRVMSLARFLLDRGFNVQKIYIDAVTKDDREDFMYLKEKYPDLLLYSTVHASMRFMANKEKTEVLAIGQKAAYFENTDHFVNVVQGGGMFGYDTVMHTMELIKDAYLEAKDMRTLIQIKGMGSEEICGCSGGCGCSDMGGSCGCSGSAGELAVSGGEC